MLYLWILCNFMPIFFIFALSKINYARTLMLNCSNNFGHCLNDLLYRHRIGALPIAIEVETRAGAVGIVHADCPFYSWQELIAELDRRAGDDPHHRRYRQCLRQCDRRPRSDAAAVAVDSAHGRRRGARACRDARWPRCRSHIRWGVG